MKVFLYILIIPILSLTVEAQFKEADSDTLVSKEYLTSLPYFPGGPEAWYKYIYENVNFPSVLLKHGVQSSIHIEVIITKNGSILEPRVVNGNFDRDTTDQIIGALIKSPKWVPAMVKEEPVATMMIIPFHFDPKRY